MSGHSSSYTGGLSPPPFRGRVREGGSRRDLDLPLTPHPTAFAQRRQSTSPARGEVTRGESAPHYLPEARAEMFQ
jgi:hypothetical protein